jgi:hypothetical protein
MNTQLALPTTLTDLLDARANALRLIDDSIRIMGMASAVLAPMGSLLMPHCARINGDAQQIRRELDASMWRRALDLTGFKQLMDAEAAAAFEKGLSPNPPEFTEGTIRATFLDLRMKAEPMFRRGVFNVFRYLSDDYRTNQKEPFRIGRKVIMSSMISEGYSTRGGLRVSHGYASDKLNDLDRVFTTLDSKPFQARSLESAMAVAFEKMEVFENEYYRAKAFRNGNLHMEFKRQDLLDKVNEQIAEFYADGALPDARAA